LAGDSAVGDVITAVGVLWLSAVVMVSAIAVVPTVVHIFSTGFCISSGVLILPAFPDVPVLSCAVVDSVAPTAVDVPGILPVSTTSADAAIPILFASRLLLVLRIFLASLSLLIYLLLAIVLFLAFLLLLSLHFHQFGYPAVVGVP
jgi:hypothetical protein